MFFTYEDGISHALDYLGAGTGSEDLGNRECRRAVINAYRDLATEHNWSYLYTPGRIQLNAAYTDGTMTFQKSSGAFPDLWTLTQDPANPTVLPSWAAFGSLRVGDLIYKVKKRTSDLSLTTEPPYSPDVDIVDASSFSLYQDTYLMPRDFSASDRMFYQQNFGGMDFISTSDWLRWGKYTNQVGEPRYYTITGDMQYPGRMVLRVFPYPGFDKTIDFVYRRTFRDLQYPSISQGSATCVNGTSTVTVAGNISLTSDMVGSVFRLSSNPSAAPTSTLGKNPASYEGIITDFSANVLTVDEPVLFSGTGLKYTISDPIDVEETAMLTAFLRGIEKQLSIQRVFKDKPSARAQYEEALRKAKAADSRSFTGQACGTRGIYRQRLARMPYDPNA